MIIYIFFVKFSYIVIAKTENNIVSRRRNN